MLPRIAGLDNAVTVIVENPLNLNRMMKPKQAVELGVADAMFGAADFIEQSLAWAAAVVKGEIAVDRRRRQLGHGGPDAEPAAHAPPPAEPSPGGGYVTGSTVIVDGGADAWGQGMAPPPVEPPADPAG